MVRQPGFRYLPVVLAAVVTLAVVGGLLHLICEDDGGLGEPAEAALSVGLGLRVLSVVFLASLRCEMPIEAGKPPVGSFHPTA